MKKKRIFRPHPLGKLALWERKMAEECRLKLPGITGWLNGGIDLVRMEAIKREKEENIGQIQKD